MARRPETRARPSTRDRMVAGAADLLRRRGVTATSLREVVRHTRTPRGSLAHHFPGGKTQLLEEAVTLARGHVSRTLAAALERHGAVAGLREFARQWHRTLESTGFEAGCPVMAVAIEEDAEAGGDSRPTDRRPRDRVQEAFDEWSGLLAAALRREGVASARARSIATLVIASFEGAIAMCRAARSTRPLDQVARELEAAVRGALPPPSA